jgi:hypothetical protein
MVELSREVPLSRTAVHGHMTKIRVRRFHDDAMAALLIPS